MTHDNPRGRDDPQAVKAREILHTRCTGGQHFATVSQCGETVQCFNSFAAATFHVWCFTEIRLHQVTDGGYDDQKAYSTQQDSAIIKSPNVNESEFTGFFFFFFFFFF